MNGSWKKGTKRRRRNREKIARRGFTLVELLAVMAIIAIILALLLVASMNGIRSAKEKATETLISKLENGINDRLEALLQYRPDPVFAHGALAHVYGTTALPRPLTLSSPIPSGAYVFALVDYIKRELPDVFFVQAISPSVNYPLNFTGNPYPLGNGNDWDYVLPLGQGGISPTNGPGLGIYGASYNTAAGLYKNISAGGITYQPTGYDGVDNNANGLIDEISEGIPSSTDQVTFMTALMGVHQHNTARSEVLYAVLVEGSGPFGSIFNRDEFTDKEVQDTDGDGMPEFVDAWGQPLQFYRWPLLYHSDLQRGQRYAGGSFVSPYDNMIEEREQDPLDLNQTLVAPAWWSSGSNDPIGTGFVPPFPPNFSAGAGGWSAAVSAFEFFFHSLHEPMNTTMFTALGLAWDRGAGPPAGPYAQRRAYYSKPLIVSWGPDNLPGNFGYYAELGQSLPTSNVTSALLVNESPAPQFDPTATVDALTLQILDNAQDDISNHALPAGGTGGSAP